MALLGALIGSIIGVYILYAIWDLALFKRVFDDPLKGKMASAAAAYFSAGTLGGFGGADGGPYFWGAFLQYLPGAIVVGVIAFRRGLKLRRENGDHHVEDIFN